MSQDNYKKDLQLTRRAFDRQVSDRDKVDLIATPGGDLQTVDGRENLAQAIINRLLTRKGELKKLGHPNYGSRLYTLVGELNNFRVQGLAEIYIRECLAREKRIEKITFIQFEKPARLRGRDELRATIGIKPVAGDRELTVTIPINQ